MIGSIASARSRIVRGGLGRLGLLACACLIFLGPATPPVAAQDGVLEMQLTAPVRQSLAQIRQTWQRWVKGYYGDDRELAETSLEELLVQTRSVGMASLPDLSIAASLYARQALSEGQHGRASLAVEAARRLDPERPEAELAQAALLWSQGRYPGSVIASVKAVIKRLRLPPERQLWLHSLALWGLAVVLISGALFVALMMASKGRRLFIDLLNRISAAISPAVGGLLITLFLLWPVFLPSGVLWLTIYWAVLLWAYTGLSERIVLIAIALVLGVTPFLLTKEHSWFSVEQSPAARVMDHVARDSLHGDLIADLRSMSLALPDHPAVRELVADLHRRFGQWEYARALYEDVSRTEPFNATALVNLGVYHHRRGDYSTAIEHYKKAAGLDKELAEAPFNLHRANLLNLDYDEADEAYGQASQIDREAVLRWDRDEETGKAVPVDGGIRRLEEIRQALQSAAPPMPNAPQGWRLYLPLAVALLVPILGTLAGRLWYQRTYRTWIAPSSFWWRWLTPGLESARQGSGFAAYGALLLGVGILAIPFLGHFGYSHRLALGAGSALWKLLAAVLLILFMAIRLPLSRASLES